MPHVWQGRVIKPGQKIHVSVSFIRDYKPKAKFSPGIEKDWNSILGKGQPSDVSWTRGIKDLLELDLFGDSNVKMILDNAKLDDLVLICSTRKFIP